MVRKVWFRLVDPRGAALDTRAGAVHLTEDTDLSDFARAVHVKFLLLLAHTDAMLLSVYETVGDVACQPPLDPSLSIDRHGLTASAPLFVRVPDRAVSPVATAAPLPARGELVLSPVQRKELYLAECRSLDSWDVGKVHDIPAIHTFFQSLGGCTDRGKVLWRKEDHDVATFILGGWLGTMERLADRKTCLVGSPGVGKSTLLCLLAFHVVFKHKKNVLIYRVVKGRELEHCLVYLGHDHLGQVVFSTVRNCKPERAIAVYDWLKKRDGVANVWLFLDGFAFENIPEGMETFHLLATSHPVVLKSLLVESAYHILHSSWDEADLFKLGKDVYAYTEDDMIHRFFRSGGSVRRFALATLLDIEVSIDNAVSCVEDIESLLSSTSHTPKHRHEIDWLRHTFTRNCKGGDSDALLNCYLGKWEQVVDSEYAIRCLYDRLRLRNEEKFIAGPQPEVDHSRLSLDS